MSSWRAPCFSSRCPTLERSRSVPLRCSSFGRASKLTKTAWKQSQNYERRSKIDGKDASSCVTSLSELQARIQLWHVSSVQKQMIAKLVPLKCEDERDVEERNSASPEK